MFILKISDLIISVVNLGGLNLDKYNEQALVYKKYRALP